MTALGLLAWLGLLPTAQAYVLPADALCRLLAEGRRQGGIRDVSLQLSADLDGRDHQVDERLYLRRPERARLVQQDEVLTEHIDREGQTVTLVDKVPTGPASPSRNLLAALLLPRGTGLDEVAQRLYSTLQAAGVQMNVVSLARQGDGVAYVIGAHVWEPDRPQLWLDKNSLEVTRIVTTQAGGDANVRLEVRLLDYGQGPAGRHFPKVFEEYEDGRLKRRSEVTAARFNQDLPDTLFDWRARRR